MDTEATTETIATTTTLALSQATGDSPGGPVTIFTATASVGTAPLPYTPWPLTMTITDSTTGTEVWSGPVGPNGGGVLSFYFSGKTLLMPVVGKLPVALAVVDPTHDFEIQAAYAGPSGYASSTSPVVAIH